MTAGKHRVSIDAKEISGKMVQDETSYCLSRAGLCRAKYIMGLSECKYIMGHFKTSLLDLYYTYITSYLSPLFFFIFDSRAECGMFGFRSHQHTTARGGVSVLCQRLPFKRC